MYDTQLEVMCISCKNLIVSRTGSLVRMPDGSVQTFKPGEYPEECKLKKPAECAFRYYVRGEKE